MLNAVLIGPQGSGKGTQARLIIKEFGLKYIEMGRLIRRQAEKHDKKSVIIDHLANKKGILLPDGIVLNMIYNEIEENPSKQGYLFDGFPRTVKQYQALKEYFEKKGLKLNTALYLYLSDQETITRLAARRICQLCKKGYSLRLEPKRTVCDCGGKLVKRPDDKQSAIKSRLKAFHKYTAPILRLMKKDGILKQINGEQSIQNIYLTIRKQLKLLD
jgi:adenylate kinase